MIYNATRLCVCAVKKQLDHGKVFFSCRLHIAVLWDLWKSLFRTRVSMLCLVSRGRCSPDCSWAPQERECLLP